MCVLLQQKQLVRSPVASTGLDIMLHNMEMLFPLYTILCGLSMLCPKKLFTLGKLLTTSPGEDTPKNKSVLLHYVPTLPISHFISLPPPCHTLKNTQTHMDLSLC